MEFIVQVNLEGRVKIFLHRKKLRTITDYLPLAIQGNSCHNFFCIEYNVTETLIYDRLLACIIKLIDVSMLTRDVDI